MRYVYVLRSEGDASKIYIGVTPDPERRLVEHNQYKCISTRKFKPWKIVYLEKFDDKETALLREKQIKKWSRKKKEALIRGDTAALKYYSKRKNW